MNNEFVSKEVFLAPLAHFQEIAARHQSELERQRPMIDQMNKKLLTNHLALPTYLRRRNLFSMEKSIERVATGLKRTERSIRATIDTLHQIAQDILLIDPIFREEALTMLRQNEKSFERNIELALAALRDLDDTVVKLQASCLT